jgi:anti-anti-sigma factor
MNSTSPETAPARLECVHGVPVVVISGRLDTHTAPVFEAQTAHLMAEKHARVLLDLAGVTFISSAGLRSILQIIKHTNRSGGRTGIFSVPEQILEAIEISGFQLLIDIYPDRETALNGSSV